MDARTSLYPERVGENIVVTVKISGQVRDHTYHNVSFTTGTLGVYGLYDDITEKICGTKGNEKFELSDEEKAEIKQSVKKLVIKARAQVKTEVETNLSGHDRARVDRIRVAKVYPNNVTALAPEAAVQVWEQQQYNLPPRVPQKGVTKEDEEELKAAALASLQQAAETFTFEPQPTNVVGYGAVDHRDMFWEAGSAPVV